MRVIKALANSPQSTSATTRRWAARRQPPPRTKCKPSMRKPSRKLSKSSTKSRICRFQRLRTTLASRIGVLVTLAQKLKARRSSLKSMKPSTSSLYQLGAVAVAAKVAKTQRDAEAKVAKANARTRLEAAETTLIEARASAMPNRIRTSSISNSKTNSSSLRSKKEAHSSRTSSSSKNSRRSSASVLMRSSWITRRRRKR